MNSTLQKRLEAKYGTAKVQELKNTFKPVKIERGPPRTIVYDKRISRKVIRRRREVI